VTARVTAIIESPRRVVGLRSVRGPSQTAVLTAVARALHRDEPPPWVLDDYLAIGLAGADGPALRERLLREAARDDLNAFSRWVCVRARFPEDIVEAAVARGVGQYVILGAGLDSFAYRRTDLLDRLRVFEVDHPQTQAWKRERLDALGVDVPGGLVFAPVDFERQTLAEGLDAAGFDVGARAVFSWIGVTMYLTLDAIAATLARDGGDDRRGARRHRRGGGRAVREPVPPRRDRATAARSWLRGGRARRTGGSARYVLQRAQRYPVRWRSATHRRHGRGVDPAAA
jgi:methyltransferase (TIGR00027 family)